MNPLRRSQVPGGAYVPTNDYPHLLMVNMCRRLAIVAPNESAQDALANDANITKIRYVSTINQCQN